MAVAQETYKLPSNGRLEDLPHTEVTLRNIETAEEKILLGSSNSALDDIVKECVVKPEDFSFDNLISADKHFLLFKLRVISYGEEYFVNYKCPHCGKVREYKVNLDELETHHLPEDFQEPYDEFALPHDKSEIALKIPRMKDLKKIDRRARRYNRKFPEAKGDIAYIYNLMANIHTVDGENMGWNALMDFVEGLSGKDSSYLRHRVSKLNVGIDALIYEDCKNCNDPIEFNLQVNAEFFRTRFDD